MNTTITLSIDAKVIENAKDYAEQQGISLYYIVEEYLKSLSRPRVASNQEFHPLIEELCGSELLASNMSYDEIIEKAKMAKYADR